MRIYSYRKFLSKNFFIIVANFLILLNGLIYPQTSYALTLGSGNCQSSYTQTTGTFTVSDSFQSGNNCIVIFKTNSKNLFLFTLVMNFNEIL